MAISSPTSVGANYGEGTITDAPLTAAAAQEIRTLTVPLGARRLFFQIKNTGGALAFDEFVVKRRPHASAAWETLASIAGDFSSPAAPLLEVQGAPVTLADGISCFIRMDVEATDAVFIGGSANGIAAITYDLLYRLQ